MLASPHKVYKLIYRHDQSYNHSLMHAQHKIRIAFKLLSFKMYRRGTMVWSACEFMSMERTNDCSLCSHTTFLIAEVRPENYSIGMNKIHCMKVNK